MQAKRPEYKRENMPECTNMWPDLQHFISMPRWLFILCKWRVLCLHTYRLQLHIQQPMLCFIRSHLGLMQCGHMQVMRASGCKLHLELGMLLWKLPGLSWHQ